MIAEITTRIHRLIVRLRSEQGISMLPAMTAVFVGSLISMGAWTAANSDVKLQQVDRYGKRAFTAAQTGLADYVQHLAVDSSYWSYCDVPPGGGSAGAVNDTDIGSARHTTRRWLPGSADETLGYQYTIDLLPTNGYSSCKANANRSLTMINQSTGSFRVRITGRAGQPVPNAATIAPDPAAPNTFVAKNASVDRAVASKSAGKSVRSWSTIAVADSSTSPISRTMRARTRRFSRTRRGRPRTVRSTTDTAALCSTGRWTARTAANAPRSALPPTTRSRVPSTPTTASTSTAVRRSATSERTTASRSPPTPAPCAPATIPSCARLGCSQNYGIYRGTGRHGRGRARIAAARRRTRTSRPTATRSTTASAISARRRSCLKTGGRADITNNGITTTDVNLNATAPFNGVIYVDSKGAGCDEYNINQNYWFPPACGSVEVEGTYDIPLTIAADRDIVITDDIEALDSAPDAVLGLIANSYVRVRHYATGDVAADGTGNVVYNSCTNTGTQARQQDRGGDAGAAAFVHGRRLGLRQLARNARRSTAPSRRSSAARWRPRIFGLRARITTTTTGCVT